MAVTFSAQSAGRVFSMMPDLTKAFDSADDILTLLKRKPQIDAYSTEGIKLSREQSKGVMEFKDVHFEYPTRRGIPVLQGLNMTVQPGQYVALVGPSGCGKSTTIGLIERFYDSLKGTSNDLFLFFILFYFLYYIYELLFLCLTSSNIPNI